MRRIVPIGAALTALALAMPVGAAARPSAHHGARSHATRHRRRVHTVYRFIAADVVKPQTATAVKTTATTTTTTTTTETPGETVGTVLSFEGGVLKITLADGSVLGAKVTETTELSCPTSGGEDEGEHGGDEGEHGGDGGAGQGEGASDDEGTEVEGTEDDEGGRGEGPTSGDSASRPWDGHGEAAGRGDGEMGSSDVAEGTCTVAALVPGAKVGEAELTLTSAGAVWERVAITR
jgi:hypothetical protein